MKFKPKHALAAVALAIAGQAGAQTLSALPNTGDPSLFFVSVDEAAGRSYFSEMVSNAGSTTMGVLQHGRHHFQPDGQLDDHAVRAERLYAAPQRRWLTSSAASAPSKTTRARAVVRPFRPVRVACS